MREQKLKTDLTIGDKLRAMRKKAGMTQEQVVIKLQLLGLSVDRHTVSNIETSHFHVRISVLYALTQVYHCTYEAIFEDIPQQFDNMVQHSAYKLEHK